MMNKKLIALLVAVATVGALSAHCYRNETDEECAERHERRREDRRSGGFFGNLGRATGGLVEDTTYTVGNVPTRLTTGESIQEIQDRHQRERENRE